jgi:hypothetical protein
MYNPPRCLHTLRVDVGRWDPLADEAGLLIEEGGGEERMWFVSGLETQGEINGLLDRLFGSYD